VAADDRLDRNHDQLRQHLADFVAAYNLARRLKTLRGLTPYEAICNAWTDDPSRFIHDPHHQIPGPNIQGPADEMPLHEDGVPLPVLTIYCLPVVATPRIGVWILRTPVLLALRVSCVLWKVCLS
jgi:hypothetical protein